MCAKYYRKIKKKILPGKPHSKMFFPTIFEFPLPLKANMGQGSSAQGPRALNGSMAQGHIMDPMG